MKNESLNDDTHSSSSGLKKLREPGCLAIWFAFILGFFAVWPALIAGVWIQSWIPLPGQGWAAQLLYAALPEETIKFTLASLLAYFSGISPSIVGAAFGISETAFVFSTTPWPLRLISSVPLHTGTTALASMAIRRRTSYSLSTLHTGLFKRTVLSIGLLTTAVMLHWIYNISVRQGSALSWIIAWIPIILWLLIRGWIVSHQSNQTD
ncbi:hypothetical protein JCM12856_29770 [Spirochaeta dissipatitropha]